MINKQIYTFCYLLHSLSIPSYVIDITKPVELLITSVSRRRDSFLFLFRSHTTFIPFSLAGLSAVLVSFWNYFFIERPIFTLAS